MQYELPEKKTTTKNRTKTKIKNKNRSHIRYTKMYGKVSMSCSASGTSHTIREYSPAQLVRFFKVEILIFELESAGL